ncbi:hypothetical protein [Burkholderia pseudomallei]|uniref:hypothetical protein n=1 Tax=Burkholderia pseudomallei TaxID=28450 RepID=UPI0009B53E22
MESPLGFAWNACSLCRGTATRFAWNTHDAHAALVVGVEGYQQKRAFRPHALLLLDPAGTEPTLFAYNARLVFDHKRPSLMTETDAYPVTFNTAVSIHPITRAAPAVISGGCA